MAKCIDFNHLESLILPCSDKVGFRDPTAIWYNGKFYCYYTYAVKSNDGFTDLQIGLSTSEDLRHWEEPILLTERDRRFNYSSPGCIIQKDGEFVICYQTYPTVGNKPGNIYGNDNCRIFIARSHDLVHWSEPELMRVHGDEVPVENMGRMIDPYIIKDHSSPEQFMVFYKQRPGHIKASVGPDGYSVEYMNYSVTNDLKHFKYMGFVECGENVCTLFHHNEYLIYNSPKNGIACLHTKDFNTYTPDPILTLGQQDWHWAQSRITAGFVLDCTSIPEIGKYLMFFHGDEPDSFPFCASIGIAWSDDLMNWEYR